uniref:Uncharacterized protein n=1 Tax=Panagrolaimus davidi TaxID=227884 RepID=A0A914PPK0_9BILA
MDIFYNESQATYLTPNPSSTSKEKAPSTAPTSPPKATLPQVSHQPMNPQPVNLQRSMHHSQYRQERPPPQPAQGDEKQQSLRQQSFANDGAAAVPQPVTPQPQGTATPSQVERQLPAETLKIFNKILQNFKEIFLLQNAADNHILLRRHSKVLTTLTEKAAWITFKATDDVTIKDDWHRYLQTCSK